MCECVKAPAGQCYIVFKGLESLKIGYLPSNLHRNCGVCSLARNAFVRTNRHAIAMMFVRLSVCLSGTGVHCDHTVHVSAVKLMIG